MRVTVRTCLPLLLAAMLGCDSESTAPPPPPPVLNEGLWTASGSPSAIVRLDLPQLSDTGARDPATVITTASARLEQVASVAFDAEGGLWVASQADDRLLRFAPADLTGSGARTASTVIEGAGRSLAGPTGLAFDAGGNLWVANFGNGTLARFDRAQLAGGGAPEPAVVISGAGQPTAIAFDAAGALWVSDLVANTVTQYTAAQLVASGSPVPSVTLGATGASLANPTGLAFDAGGHLWVANTGGRTVVAFAPGQRAASGSPVPAVTLTNPGAAIVPVGLAFDGDGGLWVVGGEGTLLKLARASLGGSGSPAPAARVAVRGYSLLWAAAFWPRPAGLPLH